MQTTDMQTLILIDTQAPAATPAQGTQQKPAQSPFGGILIPMMIVFLCFMFITTRRQKKQEREHREKLNQAKAGDRILLLGGLYGTISSVTEETIFVEVAPKTVVEYDKNSIVKIIEPQEKKAENTDK